MKNFDIKKNSNYVMLIVLVALLFIAIIITSIFLSDKNNSLNKNSKAATTPVVSVAINSTTTTPSLNTDFTVTLNMTPNINMSVQGYEVNITFDKTRLQIQDITYNNIGVRSLGLGQDNTSLTTVNNNGKIKLVAEVQSADGYSLTANASVSFATLKVKYTVTGNAQIAITENTSQFSKIETDGSITPIYVTLVSPLAVSQATPTTTVVYQPINTTTPTTSLNTTSPRPVNPTNYQYLLSPIPSTSGKQTNEPVAADPTETPAPTKASSITEPTTTQPLVMNTLSPTPKVAAVVVNEIASPLEIGLWFLLGITTLTAGTTAVAIILKKYHKI